MCEDVKYKVKTENFENMKSGGIEMGDKSKSKIVELQYKIDRKDIIMEAIKRFYKNKIQIFIGPLLIIMGIYLKIKEYNAGMWVAFIGILYMALPYILVIFNMRNISEDVVSFSVYKDKITMKTKNNKLNIKYSDIKDISEDDHFIILTPSDISKSFARKIMIPRECITSNNSGEFIKHVRSFMKSVEVTEYFGSTSTLKYEVSGEDIFKFVKQEYYSMKRYILFGGIFCASGLGFIKVNKVVGIILILLGMLYLFYPYVFSMIKIKKINECHMSLDIRNNGCIGVVGEGIDTEVPIGAIRVFNDNQDYVKIILALRSGMVFYIPKYRIIEGELDIFLNNLPKECFIDRIM